MSNIWTRFIHEKHIEEIDDNYSFVGKLEEFINNGSYYRQNLEKMDNFPNSSTDNEASDDVFYQKNSDETELMKWSSKSHLGHELQVDTYPEDVVRLIKTSDGSLYLRYSIVSEEIDDINVDSVEEAVSIIEEDNSTTEEIYPDNPELKWIKAKDEKHQFKEYMVKNKKDNELYTN